MESVSILLAFSAGLLSFLSPCVLPIIPSYVCLITGLSLKDFSGEQDKKKIRTITIKNSLVFILGFSLVFMLLGAAAGFAGQAVLQYKEIFRIGGGILVIFFGLMIMGLIRIDLLEAEKRFRIRTKPAGYIGTFFIGATFGAAWVPCVGPILASILVLASTQGTAASGMLLLAVYSLGLGIPFFISSLLINSFLTSYKNISKYLGAITFISGLLLVLMGILLLSGNFEYLSAILSF